MLTETICHAEMHSGADSVYVPEAARVVRVRRLTELDTLYDVQFESGRQLGHAPGQFVQVSILGVGECPISICSSPTRTRNFQLSVRRVGEVTRFIHQLEEGDAVGIRGPLGHGFDVAEFQDRDILMIAGGCALAPARSLIQYIIDRRDQFGKFWILYGARSPGELLFRDELEAWQESDELNCHVTVDRGDESWHGPVGVVTQLFNEVPRIDPARTAAVVIGPPVMFKFVMLEALRRGIPQNQIHCSFERRMKCGIGKCGHCQVNSLYACIDGPVLKYSAVVNHREALS